MLARAAWSALVEPGDPVAGALVAVFGAGPAFRWTRLATARGVDVAFAELGGTGTDDALEPLRRRLANAVTRWEPRLAALDPRRDLERLARVGGRLLHPASPSWPVELGDLGPSAPMALWVRGDGDLAALVRRSVALVGSRASTAYGERVATDLAEGLAARGVGVVSGGAYGIDAAAHRGALAVGGCTVVLLAGGVDRPYPQGNARLVEHALASGGAAVSEVPPGAVPLRSRFLQRNRLIAALGSATVVVEAAWRSGALSTAHHAAALLRPLGAVPGPVTSVASAGCHRLLREGAAVCVTDTAEVLELLAPAGEDLVPEHGEDARPGDDLDQGARRLLEVLPRRGAATHEDLARRAGLSVAEARAAVGVLALAGLAERSAAGWGQARRGAGPG
ncbi:DNA-processing protein DprA [Cellulomonas sp. P22]|uniref:DNA-processing protein DprA n=1 Tax=Cellulomonas sp. P22 TaxID=3373189 RepID=UPI00378C5CCA